VDLKSGAVIGLRSYDLDWTVQILLQNFILNKNI
jgi:hypothetical protein